MKFSRHPPDHPVSPCNQTCTVAGDDFLVIDHRLNNQNRAIIKINIIAVTLRNALVRVKVGDFSVAD